MKTKLKLFLTGSILLMLLAAPTMNFNVMVPAAIDFPSHIKTVAMIDRTRNENNVRNAIEGGITGEMVGEDKLAAQILMDGISDIMAKSATLDFIRTTEVLKGANSASSAFPEAIDWNVVERLCKKYGSNAILAIEIFDSDFIIIPGVSQTINLKAGLRMYDPAEKNIIDQYVVSRQMPFGGSINSVEAALNSVLGKSEAIREISYDAGTAYAHRISPSWYRVSREYYRKPRKDPNLAEGARMMEVNDWEAAKELLVQAVETGKKRKIRGRAAHNMAVVCEIEGNLEEAKTWAQTAWGKFRNKDSREYVYDLNRRISEAQVIERQLNN